MPGKETNSGAACLEDLRAVVELFGTEGRNRVRARRAPAQAWFIVTAQERLDEVTSAIGDDRRVLIAKVRDRFGYEVDLSPGEKGALLTACCTTTQCG